MNPKLGLRESLHAFDTRHVSCAHLQMNEMKILTLK